MRRTGSTEYDRADILEKAAAARARGQLRRAIELYRWVLAVERSCVEVHERLAPLLAAAGHSFDAWNSYRAVAYDALREGREDRAIASYREATRALPREIQAWQGLARLLVRQGAEEDAIEALIEGSRCYRQHWNRPLAIHLLRRARAIDPWRFETVIELAHHLGRSGQRIEAVLLLEGLADRCPLSRLRRVRAALFLSAPSLCTGWAWLSACFRRERAEPEPRDELAPVLTLAPTPDPTRAAAAGERCG